MKASTIDHRHLRRIALRQQGLLQVNPFGRGKGAVLRAITQLGYIQIDTISVIERAHHHVLRSRVANYQPKHLDRLIASGEVFEYWSHAAAFLPMQHYRYSLPRKNAYRRGENHWGRGRNKKLMAEVMQRIESEGPLRSRDFEQPRGGDSGWWDWKPAKQALEQLFMQGDLMIAGRDGFQKTYDLPERVLPPSVDTSAPAASDYAAHLIDTTLQAHGLASARSMSYLRKGTSLRRAIKQDIDARIDQKLLVEVKMDSGASYYAPPHTLEAGKPRVNRRVQILSPFDNAIIQRDRALQLFNFDYQIECYVPEPKRRFGYFCLPVLYADQFVGRMDCKAHRKQRHFEVKQLHLEDGAPRGADLVRSLAKAMGDFSDYHGSQRLSFKLCSDPQFGRELKRELKRELQRELAV